MAKKRSTLDKKRYGLKKKNVADVAGNVLAKKSGPIRKKKNKKSASARKR